MSILTKIVTPAFITAQAHIWFAAFVTYVGLYHGVTHMPSIVLALAAVKEFYIDKHFEDSQTFRDNLGDWLEYVGGVVVAMLTWTVL